MTGMTGVAGRLTIHLDPAAGRLLVVQPEPGERGTFGLYNDDGCGAGLELVTILDRADALNLAHALLQTVATR